MTSNRIWNGGNRTHVGAGISPLSRTIGAEVFGLDLAAPLYGREEKRIIRTLRHRKLICIRRAGLTSLEAERAAARIARRTETFRLGGVLAAPANLEAASKLRLVDLDLAARFGEGRAEVGYEHRWRAGDVLIWTDRLGLAG